MADIIVVDDDERTCRSLCRFLTLAGHDVRSAGSGDELDAALALRQPDIVLLDIGLPGERGTAIARRMREGTEARIVMVTGVTDKNTRVQAVANGADYYLVKPIDVDELAVVIENLLRRRAEANLGSANDTVWALDVSARLLTAPGGRSAELTVSEYAFLAGLMEAAGKPVRRDTIAIRLGYRPEQALNGLEAIVTRLRRKIETETEWALPVKSVRGIGYLFTATAVVRG